MPDNQALQVFYGTIPLILVIAAAWFRESMLLHSILDRLKAIENRMTSLEATMSKVKERLVVLETRAGVIYHE